MADFTMVGAGAPESVEIIKRRIDDSKLTIKAELANYDNYAKELRAYYKDLLDKKKRYDKNPGPKTTPDFQIATVKFNKCRTSTVNTLMRLDSYIENVKTDWEKLIAQLELATPKKANKEKDEYQKYIKDVDSKKKKVDDALVAAGITLDRPDAVKVEAVPVEAEEPVAVAAPATEEAAPVAEEVTEAEAAEETADASVMDSEEPETEETVEEFEEVVVEEEPDDTVAEPAYDASMARGSVNLAPISIDLSDTVERVVAEAMNKFSATLDRRIDEYFKDYTPAYPVGVASVGGAGSEAVDLEGKIAEDEKFLADKLVGIVEVLKGLNTAMATITSAYAELDARFRKAVDLQKQTNDMMRHTLREQQGVQVTQRVISQDQLAIAEEQASMADAQKLAIEEQKALTEAQAALAETQNAVKDTQLSLEGAMKDLIKGQKRVLQAQEAISAQTEKQLEAQKDAAARQAEIAEEQKGMLTSLRQTLKDQKAAAARQAETAELQRTSLDDVKEILKNQRATSQKTSKRRPDTEE